MYITLNRFQFEKIINRVDPFWVMTNNDPREWKFVDENKENPDQYGEIYATINRLGNGSWCVFLLGFFLGIEPNREYAQKAIENMLAQIDDPPDWLLKSIR